MEGFLNKCDANSPETKVDEFLSELCLWLEMLIKRAYICNKLGNQLSSNVETEDGVIKFRNYRNVNWSWRGFFQDAMKALDTGRKSHMSESYRDVITKEKIYTYVYQIHPDMYLFLDTPV
jgi:hypothetical protein